MLIYIRSHRFIVHPSKLKNLKTVMLTNADYCYKKSIALAKLVLMYT